MQQLNTQLWNLGTTSLLAAIGLGAAACGPVVAIEGETDGGESESASDTIIDPSSPTDPTNPTDPTDPTGGGCESEDECPDGFYCSPEGQCIEDYDCYDDYDYGCYCVYGHCSPGYDCYDDQECGTGEICEGYGYCNPIQSLPDCGTPATLVGTPIPIPTGNPVASLSFVDLDPETLGEDLVLGTDIDGWLIPSGGAAVPLPSEGAVRGAASTDLDGDGATDLILIDDAGLRVIYGFGTETPETVTLSSEQPSADVHALQSVEGLPSLVVQGGDGLVYTLAGSSERVLELVALPVQSDGALWVAAFALGDGSDGVLSDPSSGNTLLYTLGADTVPIGNAPRDAVRSTAVGALTGAERSDVLWSTRYADWTLLEISIGAGDPEYRALYFDYETVEIGDLDGDGYDDALAVGGGGLAVMPGDPDWGLTCFSQSPFVGGGSRQVAVGDLDADGSDEAIVITDAGGAPTAYDVSWAP